MKLLAIKHDKENHVNYNYLVYKFTTSLFRSTDFHETVNKHINDRTLTLTPLH